MTSRVLASTLSENVSKRYSPLRLSEKDSRLGSVISEVYSVTGMADMLLWRPTSGSLL